MNQQQVTQREIDDGNTMQVLDIDSNKPFAIVLPISAGTITFREVPDMQNNLAAVLEVMKFIYDHIIYAELNTKSDYCQVCGWDGEIEVVEEDGKLIWNIFAI